MRRRREQTRNAEPPASAEVEPLPTGLDGDEHELAKTLLAESREELTRADGKAALLLAALGIGLSAILAAILAGDWSPFDLKEPYQGLWWAGSSFAGVSLFSLCAAVYPKVRHDNPAGGVSYFGDIAPLKTVSALRAALKRSETDLAERTVSQLHVIARLVDRKYRFLRIGLVALGLGIAFTLAAVLAAHFA
jgi:hypothetical protein